MPMSKKNAKCSNAQQGYTLVELLVAVACASVMLSALTGALIFTSAAANKLSKASQETRLAKAAYDYILSLDISEAPQREEFSVDGENLIRNGKSVLRADGLKDICFEEKGEFLFCKLVYSDKTYEFAAGALN